MELYFAGCCAAPPVARDVGAWHPPRAWHRVALQFARKHGVRTDEDLAQTVALATRDAASFVSRPVHDVVVGSRADIVLFDALNVQDALVRAPERALVIAGGRVVARDGNVLV